MRSSVISALYQMLFVYQIKANEIGGVCSANGEMRKAYKFWFKKPEEKRALGRSMLKWEDNIREMV